MKHILFKSSLLLMLLTLFSTQLWSHGAEGHESKKPTEVKKEVSSLPTNVLEKNPEASVSDKDKIIQETYKQINTVYLAKIKPIFEKKCFDCHGTLKKKPWYYDIPGISYMIQKDMKEAKEHMDMRKDFPFVSHETPYNDLKSVREIGLNGGMPPLQYIIGHWDTRLTDQEHKALIRWSEKSMQLIKDQGIEIKKEVSH